MVVRQRVPNSLAAVLWYRLLRYADPTEWRGTGSHKPIIRNPDLTSLNRTYNSGRIVSPAPSATAWRMRSWEVISSTTWVLICAFAYSASTIFRGQYSTGMNTSGGSPRSCICKRDWDRAITCTSATGRSLKRDGSYDEAICGVGMGGRIQCHGGLSWLCGN
jgi:hypothetical protein